MKYIIFALPFFLGSCSLVVKDPELIVHAEELGAEIIEDIVK